MNILLIPYWNVYKNNTSPEQNVILQFAIIPYYLIRLENYTQNNTDTLDLSNTCKLSNLCLDMLV